jgi:hypothetical protein
MFLWGLTPTILVVADDEEIPVSLISLANDDELSIDSYTKSSHSMKLVPPWPDLQPVIMNKLWSSSTTHNEDDKRS